VTGSVAVTLTGYTPGKPPLSWLTVDVTLRNDELTPCWFLVPVSVATSWPEGGDAIDRVQAFTLGGSRRVVLGRLDGLREWHALRLPGAGEVRVRELPLIAFDEAPPFSLEVVGTGALSLAGRPAQEVFPGGDPTCAALADVTAAQRTELGSWRADGGPAPLTALTPRRYNVTLPLPVDA
jgi:hypothetical protein